MVYEKNMRRKYFFLLIFFLFSGCSQNIITNKEKDSPTSGVLKLNVEELNIVFVENEQKKTSNEFLDENIYQIKKIAISKLRHWSSVQFAVLGKKNKSTLRIIIPNIKVKEKEKLKGLKKILAKKKETYLFKTDINLLFITSDEVKKKLDIVGEIEIILKDEYSINQRKNKIEKSLNSIIKAISEEINNQLSKDNYRSLVLRN